MTTAAKIILTVTMRYIPQKIKNDESLGALVQIKVLFCMCYASISKKSWTACWHILKQWMQKMNSLPFFNTGWIHANANGHKCSHENKKATTYFIIKNIFDLPNIFFMIKWTYGFYIFMWRNCVIPEELLLWNMPWLYLQASSTLPKRWQEIVNYFQLEKVERECTSKRWQEVEDRCERIEHGRIPAQTPRRTAGKIYISLWGIFRQSCLAQIPFSTWITRKTAQLSLQMRIGRTS